MSPGGFADQLPAAPAPDGRDATPEGPDAPEATSRAWQPLSFDFDAATEPPNYLIDGLLEPGNVGVLSGDTGAGKSWAAMDLAVAALRRRSWLGRTVGASRVMVIDEENSDRLVASRLRALGLTNEERAGLLYFCQQGIQLDAPTHLVRLRAQVAEHIPDLLIVDTVMAATAVEINVNEKVVALYRTLRRLARESGLAVLLLHHERKQQQGLSRAPGHNMMGARQFAGQADLHLSLTHHGYEARDTEAGTEFCTRADLGIEKLRDGVPTPSERIEITSTRDDRDCLVTAAVLSTGLVEKEPTKAETLLEQIHVAVRAAGGVMRRLDIANAVGCDTNDGTFSRALKAGLQEGGPLTKTERSGEYALADPSAAAPAI